MPYKQNSMLGWLVEPFKFAEIKRNLYLTHKSRNIRYLDIGCGNHSAMLSRKYLPNIEYWGVDNGDYNNDADDFKAMYKFINDDLDKSDLSIIPDSYFDVIVLSHVIEHLKNYEVTLAKVLPKLNEKGIVYIETPTIDSTRFPSRKGTLNFFDDSTHLNPIPLDEIKNLFGSYNFVIASSGIRKFKRRILLFPLFLLFSIYEYGSVIGPALWDIYGFSWYLVATPGSNS
jgi:hypothetical protein